MLKKSSAFTPVKQLGLEKTQTGHRVCTASNCVDTNCHLSILSQLCGDREADFYPIVIYSKLNYCFAQLVCQVTVCVKRFHIWRSIFSTLNTNLVGKWQTFQNTQKRTNQGTTERMTSYILIQSLRLHQIQRS